MEVELADAEARVSVLETTLAGLEVVREVEKYEEPVLSFTKTFGGEEDDRAHLVQQTTDGGYIIAGSTESFGTGSLDIYVIKTDGEGNEEWSQTFGGEKDDIASSVQQTTDGGYIIAGLTMHWGNGDVYLVKTDGEGNEEWSRAFGGMEDDRAFSVQQTTDGGYIIAGDTKSYGVGGSDVYLVKTDGVGNGEWSQTFGGEDGDRAFSVQQTTDGGYIIAGGTASYGAGYTDVYLVKTDGGGNEEWYRTFGGEGYDEAFSVQQTADGGYIIAGDTESFGVGNSDAYLVKTDGEGNGEWSRTFGGEAYDTAYVGQHGGTTAQQTADGGYIIAGGTASYGAGNSDVYVIKVSITITEVVEIKIIGQ
ncbi:MAG: hypothetical protein QGG15_00885 [Dehalococcoidales bacterium]|nr:hypothetical protein [Dehalococcoidales bacterium]MDP6737577.1 hypothetical protein [Dehalococcoidales bacterium]